jgi:hypothetical protein
MTEPSDSPRGTQAQIERIRRQRNTVMALLLGAFVVLVFAISIVKFGAQ